MKLRGAHEEKIIKSLEFLSKTQTYLYKLTQLYQEKITILCGVQLEN